MLAEDATGVAIVRSRAYPVHYLFELGDSDGRLAVCEVAFLEGFEMVFQDGKEGATNSLQLRFTSILFVAPER